MTVLAVIEEFRNALVKFESDDDDIRPALAARDGAVERFKETSIGPTAIESDVAIVIAEARLSSAQLTRAVARKRLNWVRSRGRSAKPAPHKLKSVTKRVVAASKGLRLAIEKRCEPAEMQARTDQLRHARVDLDAAVSASGVPHHEVELARAEITVACAEYDVAIARDGGVYLRSKI